MNKLSHESFEATKVIVKAGVWVDRRRAAEVAPEGKPKARAVGLYVESGNELERAVEQYRKAGGQP